MNKNLQILNLAFSCAAFIRKDSALKSYNPLGQIIKSNMSLGDSSEEKEPEKQEKILPIGESAIPDSE